jgi:hypothetical protein
VGMDGLMRPASYAAMAACEVPARSARCRSERPELALALLMSVAVTI